MITAILDTLSGALSGSFGVALVASLLWGVASIVLSPCHLSSIPLVIGFINAQAGTGSRRPFALSLAFSLGILVTIAAIGVLTAMLGRLLGDIGSAGTWVVAGVFFLVGLYFFDVIDLSRFGMNVTGTSYRGWVAALVLGLLFGIGLGPCAFAFMAPVLGVVFEIARTQPVAAVALLAAFAVGHCAVIVLAGTTAERVQRYLNWTEHSRAFVAVKRVCGVLVMLGGAWMVYSTFQ